LAARGWRAGLSAAQQRGLFAMAAAAPPERRLNLNTAPPEVLRAVFGLDERAAAQVLAAREQSPLQSVEEIAKLAGVRAVSDGAAVGVLPGRRLRLTVGLDAPRAGQAAIYQSQLVLAPDGADRPFYRRRIAGRASERRTEGGGRDGGLDELPHSPDLLAARGR
ncbi:type II secretion system protein GspK, partial [Caulobacter sp. 17J65-9]|uniref:type II secretion system protein GspK n=1 Tax=Caulobacter sp. 17J65-9 TaxID=2709382 RepID=UPI0013C959C7